MATTSTQEAAKAKIARGPFRPGASCLIGGVYNVHGNVLEWCEDTWHDTYNGAPADGSAWISGSTQPGARVVRGGSWICNPWYLRAAGRIGYTVGINFIGFRVARTLTS